MYCGQWRGLGDLSVDPPLTLDCPVTLALQRHYLVMSSDSLSAFQADIVRRCQEHDERREKSKPHSRCCIVFGKYFVKYDGHRPLYHEYATQQYIYNH
ncbi:hypothetical protein NEOLEDRAFT_1136746 [Neolentinus lepideus HHB14362 ss-1]|uniref:Uncharacterized protein n=1 Tax=Neolentinus lepideus HHB14362 ss-1 TaxID=1314782 RepID=A0A165R692_9AGAM|nr:hypothetical protein NEOLEDRAFT_1136746 [Neolentinus lepideus HHB14362 ss-1]